MIPQGKITLKTESSEYEFGPVQSDGYRQITRNGRLLDSGIIKGAAEITLIGVGVVRPGEILVGMRLAIQLQEYPDHIWVSTPVQSFEVEKVV